jgi:phosphate transport system substrate-binding protein
MNRTQFNLLLIGLSLFIGLFPSCGNKPSDDTYNQQSKYFAADESLSPIINEELDIFNMKNKRDSIYPLYISEQEAVEKLMNQEVLLVFTTRRLTPNEEETLKQMKYRPTCTELAYDALALIVNKENSDTLITVDTFRKIMAGEVTQWSDIYPDSKLGKIKVAFDNPKSATLRYVVDSIMQGKELKTDGNVKAAMTSAEVVEYVENNKNAIGVVGSIWLNDQRDTTNLTYNRNITVMKVGRASEARRETTYKPSQWNIAYNYYPFIRTIYAICIDPRSTGVPRAFKNFCWLPNPGQLIFFNAGLFPARAEYSVRDVVID